MLDRRTIGLGKPTRAFVVDLVRIKKTDVPLGTDLLVPSPPRSRSRPCSTDDLPNGHAAPQKPPRRVQAASGRERVKKLLEDDRAGWLVPSAQVRSKRVRKTEWVDPDDVKPDAKREPRKIRGFRVPDPLEALDFVSKDHFEAANKLRKSWEISQGARPGSSRMMRVGGGFESGAGPTWHQVRAIQEVERIQNALGVNWLAVRLVVLMGLTASAMGARMGMSRHTAVGYLRAALDRLVEVTTPRSKQRHTIREDA